MSGKLAQSDSQYLRERTVDFTDAGNRVLDHLLYTERTRLSDIREPSILVTHNLMPSDTLGLDRALVLGIAADAGGKTSHTAILARAGGDPRGPGALRHQPQRAHRRRGDRGRQPRDGHRLPRRGHARPLRRTAQGVGAHHGRAARSCATFPRRPWTGSVFPSRRTSRSREEAEGVLAHGADGIGLFRSEFLFIQPGPFPHRGRAAGRLHVGPHRDEGAARSPSAPWTSAGTR